MSLNQASQETAGDALRLPPAPRIAISSAAFRWLGWNFLVTALYWLTLTYAYIYAVSPINGNSVYLYMRVNPEKIAEGAFWALALLPSINTGWRRPSDFGLTILYYLALIPFLIMYGLADQSRFAVYAVLAGYCCAVLTCRFPMKIPDVHIQPFQNSAIYVAAGGVILITLWYVTAGGGDFNIDLKAVYSYRDDAVAVFDHGPLNYIAAWTPFVLNPFVFCYCLLHRRWVLFAAFFIFQIFCLVIFQQKSVFIPALMLPLLYFAGSSRAGRLWFLLFWIASIIACQVIYEYYDLSLFVQFWTRRFFFVQQFFYYSYFDIFGKIGFVYYSDSFLSSIIDYPFRYPPSILVEYYLTGQDGSPNTGFFGAGYKDMGVLGVLLCGAMAGIVLRLFDRITSPDTPMWFFGTVAFLPFMAMLVAQNFLTSISTGGVFMLAVLMLGNRGGMPKKASLPSKSRP